MLSKTFYSFIYPISNTFGMNETVRARTIPFLFGQPSFIFFQVDKVFVAGPMNGQRSTVVERSTPRRFVRPAERDAVSTPPTTPQRRHRHRRLIDAATTTTTLTLGVEPSQSDCDTDSLDGDRDATSGRSPFFFVSIHLSSSSIQKVFSMRSQCVFIS